MNDKFPIYSKNGLIENSDYPIFFIDISPQLSP